MTDAADPRPPAPAPPPAALDEVRMRGRQVYDGMLLDVRRDEVRLPDGTPAVREYIVHPGAVLVVPVRDDGRLVVVRQFRYPLRRVFIEFPAGKLDAGETPEACARRETIEETGYEVGRLAPLALLHPAIAYATETIHCFVGESLRHVGARLDAGEFLEVVTMSQEELLAALDRGEITDGKTMTALLMYARRAVR